MTDEHPHLFKYPAWRPEYGVIAAESEWQSVCESIHLADIVIVHDTEKDLKAVIYGQKLLAHIRLTGREESCRIETFGVDMTTDALEALCALCLAMKGGYDNTDGRWFKAKDIPPL